MLTCWNIWLQLEITFESDELVIEPLQTLSKRLLTVSKVFLTFSKVPKYFKTYLTRFDALWCRWHLKRLNGEHYKLQDVEVSMAGC